jgi:thiamine-phosphate pyrophosphorylase
MLRYAITSRSLYPGNEQEKQAALIKQTDSWITEGINFIQLREKDLCASDQIYLASKIIKTTGLASSPTKLLVNSRPDISLATGAHGVHLSASPDELSPTQISTLFHLAGRPKPLISMSCHTLSEVHRARHDQVDAILFAPVFEKPLANGQRLSGKGLDQLRSACAAAAPIPVYALGGVTLQNAPSCLEAGASGIAGIRLFHLPQENASNSAQIRMP